MLRPLYTNDLFTTLLLIGIVTIALAKSLAPKRFEDFILVIGNSKYLKLYSKDVKFFDRFDWLLFFNLTLNLTVFGIIISKQLFKHDTADFTITVKLAIAINCFILIKTLFERIIGNMFEINKLVGQYLFQKMAYRNYFGLLLIPTNSLLLFQFKDSIVLIFIIIVLFFLLYLIGFISSFKSYQSLILPNLFYFILYLCALEIAPLIILYKAFIA